MDAQVRQALSHSRRRAILGCIMQANDRGVGERELAETLGLAASTVKYHVGVLCSTDLIMRVDIREPNPCSYVAVASR